jgi:hypothetical protein
MENNNLSIEIEYCRKNGYKNILNIPIHEYYEEPDDNEILEYDSTPKYLEQYEYISENIEELDWSILRIFDNTNNINMISEEKYWGILNRHRMSIVTLYRNNEIESWDQTIEISESKAETIHILRVSTSTPENVGGLISHTIIEGTGENEKVIIVKSK